MSLDRVGTELRALRRRARRSQGDVARVARVSASTISRIERGVIDGVSVGSLVAVARALEARLDLRVRWRGADLDRLVAGRHAAVAESLTRRLVALGWLVRPEISFAFGAERGVVDLLCWHPATGTLLLVEIKTRLIDLGEVLGTFDRKVRLASRIAARFDWRPTHVGVVLAIEDGRSNRRHASAFAAVLEAALSDDGRRTAAWLRRPDGDLRGRIFLPTTRETPRRQSSAGRAGR